MSFEVTAFARTTTPSQWGVRTLHGSVLVHDDVLRAADGQDAVVWAVGGRDAIRRLLAGKPRQRRLCEDGTKNVIAAMRARGDLAGLVAQLLTSERSVGQTLEVTN